MMHGNLNIKYFRNLFHKKKFEKHCIRVVIEPLYPRGINTPPGSTGQTATETGWMRWSRQNSNPNSQVTACSIVTIRTELSGSSSTRASHKCH